MRLDLVSLEWVKEPSMNYGRVYHSSCAFENALFVFCGGSMENENEKSETIEKLSTKDEALQQRAWQIITPKNNDFPRRDYTMSAPLNCHEILIFGGSIMDQKNEEEFTVDATNGILTYNITTNRYKEIVKDSIWTDYKL